MKALILAAGIGSRLRPQTNEIPKCLIKINKQDSILDTQIKALISGNVKDITVVVGYRASMIKDYIKENYTEINFTFIENEKYLTTNNMYSFLLAKPYLENQSFVSLNADVAIDSQIISKLVESPSINLIAVDKNSYSEESMKIKIEEPTGKITGISKQIKEEDSYATSIDVYKISKDASRDIFAIAQCFIETGDEDKWFEVALNEGFQNNDFYPKDIKGLKWFEIDDQEDLILARDLFQ